MNAKYECVMIKWHALSFY